MQKRSNLTVAVVAFTFGATLGLACGSGSSGDPASGGGSLQGKCEQLVKLSCQRQGECSKNTSMQKQCEEDEKQLLRCSETRGVSMTFDMCIHDLQSVSCGSLMQGRDFAPPGSCNGVLDVPPTPAQMKCLDLGTAICKRIIECTKSGTQDDCEAAVLDLLGCEDATDVGPTYDQCVQTLTSGTCMTLFADGKTLSPPMACNGVVLTDGPAPGGGGGGAGGAGGGRTGPSGAGGKAGIGP